MFSRKVQTSLKKALKSFPAVILTGARQTGKTTLCRELLSKSHRYVSLENPDIRALALEDPRSFLESYPPPLILDEIQYAPLLVNYLQEIIDQDRQKCGQFVLTGSQNFLLMEQVSQSLAGRAALFSLYGLSAPERFGAQKAPLTALKDLSQWILRGAYPELHQKRKMDRRLWCGSYIRLYLERDVRQITNVGDLESFERFLRLVAARTGQLLNLNDLARDAGVSQPTAKRWIDLLKASYQIVLLEPYFVNISKRLVKAPKLYFTDTGLATYLMGIHQAETLRSSPYWGALFETAVVMEHIKQWSARGDLPALSFFRSHDGIEVDLILEENAQIFLKEIKSNKTPNPHWKKPLERLEKLLDKKCQKQILAPVEKRMKLGLELELRPWTEVL